MENGFLSGFKQKFGGKRILILGFAREGIDTLRFLHKLFPNKVIGVADQLDARRLTLDARKAIASCKRVMVYSGHNYLKSVRDYDIIIKSPGIPLKMIAPFLKRAQVLTSQTEIFFDNCPGKIVGVTGTKGKSTTTSLIYDVLRAGGLPAFLVGNIGRPVLSLLLKAKPDDIFVYELSSHQLSGLRKSPTVAVFLNIYPEHLDYYRNFQEYLKAKQNICRYQTKNDIFLFNPKNKYVRETVRVAKGIKIPLNPKKAELFLRKRGDNDVQSRLLGGFNFLNMAAAIEVGRIFKVPDKVIAEAILAFKPLPHRLEFVGEYHSVRFYNDSLATIPEATIAAIEALGKGVETIFLGGFDRGLDFKKLAQVVVKSNIKNLVFFPTTGERIWTEIKKVRNQGKRCFNRLFIVNIKPDKGVSAMKTAVGWAYRHTAKNKTCLLSCASPSFGLFKDYRERGDLFKKSVRALSLKR